MAKQPKPKKRKKTYEEQIREGDQIMEDMQRTALRDIFDLGTDRRLDEGIESGVKVIRKQLQELEDKASRVRVQCQHCKKFNWSDTTAEAKAKIVAAVTKAVDELFRLKEFAQGKADSRPEVTASNALMELLSDYELQKLQERAEGKNVPRVIH